MAEFHITREYPHSAGKLWHALTDPELVPLWTVTGRGGRPEGFRAEAGTHFSSPASRCLAGTASLTARY